MATTEKNEVQYDDEFIYSDFRFSEGATPPMLEDLLNRGSSVKIVSRIK